MNPPSLERFPPLKLILSKIEFVCIIDMAPFFWFRRLYYKGAFLILKVHPMGDKKNS